MRASTTVLPPKRIFNASRTVRIAQNRTHVTLADLLPGESATVRHIVDSPLKRRLQELGLDSGVTVRCVCRSPLGDPTAYEFASGTVAIRRTDAESVRIWD